jgi:hypothetical protein
LQEISAHQGVQPLVTGRVLNKARLITETIAACGAHTMEMRLVFPIAALSVLTVLVESADERE